MADTVDPLGGSYYLENLTNEIYERAAAYIQKIDELGGSAEAIEKGFVQREIQDSAYRYQREIEKEERIVVGLNRFQVEEEKPTNLLRVDPSVRTSQIERLRKLRSERDYQMVKKCLADLKQGAERDQNMIPVTAKPAGRCPNCWNMQALPLVPSVLKKVAAVTRLTSWERMKYSRSWPLKIPISFCGPAYRRYLPPRPIA